MRLRQGNHWVRTIAIAVMATAMLAVVAEAGHRRWARRCGFRNFHRHHHCCTQPYVAHNACCSTFVDPCTGYATTSGQYLQQQPMTEAGPAYGQPTPSEGIADVTPSPAHEPRVLNPNRNRADTEGQIAGQPAQPDARQALRPDFDQTGRIQELEQQVDNLKSQVTQLNRRVRQLQQRQEAPADTPRANDRTETEASRGEE